MMGTTGRARIAPPVAIAAETPQMDMPDASGAAHSLLNLKYLRAMIVDDRPVDEIGLDNGAEAPEHDVGRKAERLRGLEAQARAHDNDGGLDVQFGPGGLFQFFGQLGKKFPTISPARRAMINPDSPVRFNDQPIPPLAALVEAI